MLAYFLLERDIFWLFIIPVCLIILIPPTICLFQVNHDFRKNNSVYRAMEHPRWGAIMGVWTTTNVALGDEILTYYGYKGGKSIPYDFPWYWESKKREEESTSTWDHIMIILKWIANIDFSKTTLNKYFKTNIFLRCVDDFILRCLYWINP